MKLNGTLTNEHLSDPPLASLTKVTGVSIAMSVGTEREADCSSVNLWSLASHFRDTEHSTKHLPATGLRFVRRPALGILNGPAPERSYTQSCMISIVLEATGA